MKILLVEDNQPLRETVETLLTEKGHTVETASDGELGLQMALNWDYDVILADVMMPKLDGLDLLKKLRLKKSTPTIMITARNSIDDKVAGLEAGADDYITKPFDLKELLARINSVCRRTNSAAQNIISEGSIKIDTLKRDITFEGQTLSCTSKEYSLIELLTKHWGTPISRSEIYKLIFEDEDEHNSNVLEVYIYKLRKKLGKNMIRTKRGVGYIMGS